jgi:hypothetical protein
MLVAIILATHTFTIQIAGRTQENLFVLPKGTFGGNVFAEDKNKIKYLYIFTRHLKAKTKAKYSCPVFFVFLNPRA